MSTDDAGALMLIQSPAGYSTGTKNRGNNKDDNYISHEGCQTIGKVQEAAFVMAHSIKAWGALKAVGEGLDKKKGTATKLMFYICLTQTTIDSDDPENAELKTKAVQEMKVCETCIHY